MLTALKGSLFCFFRCLFEHLVSPDYDFMVGSFKRVRRSAFDKDVHDSKSSKVTHKEYHVKGEAPN